MKDYAIVIADDHQLFRSGMKRLIAEKEGLMVVGEANDGVELLDLLASEEAQMAIVDLTMPNLQGLEAARKIKKQYPELKLLALTMHRNVAYLHHALSVGFDGYLLKDDSDMELLTAIETIRANGRYITTQLAGDQSDAFALAKKNDPGMLSLREIEVLELLVAGQSNKAISEKMQISIRTVENHRSNIMKKLNLRNVADLVRYAIQNGLIQITAVPHEEDDDDE